jgi:hypothetical protein
LNTRPFSIVAVGQRLCYAVCNPFSFFRQKTEWISAPLWIWGLLSLLMGFIYLPIQASMLVLKSWIFLVAPPVQAWGVCLEGGVLMLDQFLLAVLTLTAMNLLTRRSGLTFRHVTYLSFYLAVGLWTFSMLFVYADSRVGLLPVQLTGPLAGPAIFYLRFSHVFQLAWLASALFQVFYHQLRLTRLVSVASAILMPLSGRFMIEHPNVIWRLFIRPSGMFADPTDQLAVYFMPHVVLLFLSVLCLSGLAWGTRFYKGRESRATKL